MTEQNQELKAYAATWDHIDLVLRLLASAQIELMRRAATHDRSKLRSPEWEMFAEITHKLEGLTYGSPEYEAQRKEMLGLALGHHYEHNRHHPEHFQPSPEDTRIRGFIEMLKLSHAEGQLIVMPDDEYGLTYLIEYLERKQQEAIAPVNGMNLFDLLEMLIDWQCACKRHADGDIQESLRINRDRFALSPQLLQILANTVPWIVDEFERLNTQKDLKPQ